MQIYIKFYEIMRGIFTGNYDTLTRNKYLYENFYRNLYSQEVLICAV